MNMYIDVYTVVNIALNSKHDSRQRRTQGQNLANFVRKRSSRSTSRSRQSMSYDVTVKSGSLSRQFPVKVNTLSRRRNDNIQISI